MSHKYVYLFTEGNGKMRELLGGKGANLAEMTNLGLPVPQGFTISTEACTQYYADGRKINDEIREQIMDYVGKMEKITGKKFGDLENPLLVSVRSGARASMPGMMDTILNLGLNEDVVDVIAKKSNNPRWAWDCYRRFIQMYSDVVMEVGKKYFEKLIDEMKTRKGVHQDTELTAEDLKELAGQFKAEYKEKIRTLQEQLQHKNEKIDAAKDKILREANEKARAILQEAKDVADETISDFNKVTAGADIKELEKKRQKVRDKINEKNEKLTLGNPQKKNAGKKALDPKKLKKGDSVKILSMNLKGTVSTLPDAKGNLFVQCGIMRIQSNIGDLVLTDEPTITAPSLQRSGTGKIKMSKSLSVSTEINLLGRTVDEALAELDKYLDDAYLAHLPSVRVVHGKGTGALRSAIHNHLKRLKYVKEYRLGEYGEGDAGVTIVTFK